MTVHFITFGMFSRWYDYRLSLRYGPSPYQGLREVTVEWRFERKWDGEHPEV
jgi:hypothetical protein